MDFNYVCKSNTFSGHFGRMYKTSVLLFTNKFKQFLQHLATKFKASATYSRLSTHQIVSHFGADFVAFSSRNSSSCYKIKRVLSKKSCIFTKEIVHFIVFTVVEFTPKWPFLEFQSNASFWCNNSTVMALV